MLYKYMTGLEETEINELVARIETILTEQGKTTTWQGNGRKPVLDLYEQVVLTLTSLRTNITQELAGAYFGVSQPTVSLVKSRIEPLLDQALAMTGISLGEAAATRPIVVDGTYVPTGNRRGKGRENYSGKRHCQGLSIQVACDLQGRLLATSTPVPGARHDAAAIGLVGWVDTLTGANWVADGAYSATGAITPIRKKPHIELAEDQRSFNKQVSAIRCVVERCIAHLKNWKIIAKGYRRQLGRLPFTIALVTKLELYRLGW